MEVGRYNVDGMLGAHPKELYLIVWGLLGEIWGWLIHAMFVLVVEVPVYVCPHSSWWVA